MEQILWFFPKGFKKYQKGIIIKENGGKMCSKMYGPVTLALPVMGWRCGSASLRTQQAYLLYWVHTTPFFADDGVIT